MRRPIFFGELAEQFAASAGHVQTDVWFVEAAADTDLSILDHITGHQHLVLQQDGAQGLDPRLGIDLFSKWIDVSLGNLFCRARVSFF